MGIGSFIYTLLFVAVYIIIAIKTNQMTLSLEKENIIRVAASMCIILGILIFTSGIIFGKSSGIFDEDVEWPIGWSNEGLKLNNGNIAFPDTNSGRVQIYTSELDFLTGWYVNSHGGGLVLKLGSSSSIIVRPYRDDNIYEYTYDGNLINSEIFDHRKHKQFGKYQNETYILSPWYLMIFSSPFFGGCLSMVGLIVAGKYKKPNKSSNVDTKNASDS